jgi:gliding motility-associated-like protein
MNGITRSLVLWGYFVISGLFSLRGQNAIISGPKLLCLGECGTYILTTPENIVIYNVSWTANGTALPATGQQPLTLCADNPTGITLSASGFTSNQQPVTATTVIEIVTAINLDIISTVAACQDSTVTACDRVCANTSATYQVAGLSPGLPVSWQVSGAESYKSYGNLLTVKWGAPGRGKVTAITGGETCKGESSLCVEILAPPDAVIGSAAPVLNDTLQVCRGQTVYFENYSQNATSYSWNFGDLNTSTQSEPAYTYNVPGSYKVLLVSMNACYCSDSAFITVNVLPAKAPDISCIGTVCEGEAVTYSTPADCSFYDWDISYGTILSGGGPTDELVSVQWLSGPEGAISLQVNGCDDNYCNLPNVVPVPIISDNVQIQGPAKVCEGSTGEYFIPDYAGTKITWKLLGSGEIIAGQHTERIVAHWFGNVNEGNPQQVVVEFDNCYLGCGGRDTLDVFILPGFYIEGPAAVCENTAVTYRSRNTIVNSPMNSHWRVFNSNGILVWSSSMASSMANIPFNFPPGNYTVRASAVNLPGFCNSTYEAFVKIEAAPPLVIAIDGETKICPGTAYTYHAQGLPSHQFVWSVEGGAPLSFVGPSVNINWGPSQPFSVSVVQIATTGLACASKPVDIQVNPLPDFEITGQGQICREQTGTFSVPFFENISYEWTITPADAGTVISGQGSQSIEVLWHDDGPATVSVAGCSFNKSTNVQVLPLPEPVVPDAQVCIGKLAMVTTTVPYVGYSWKNENGIQVSTLPNPTLGGGFYKVEVTDANGCRGNTIFEIVEKPIPAVSISTPNYLGLCPGGPDVTIFATALSGGLDYAWFRNNVPAGSNSNTLSTHLPGAYKVVVSDQYGCTGESNVLTLDDCATAGGSCIAGVCANGAVNGLPGDPCVDGGNIAFSVQTTADCGTHQYQNTATNFIPGTLGWNFGDPLSGAANTSVLENPVHSFSGPGFYTVLLMGSVPNTSNPNEVCPDGQIIYDTVLAVADFENSKACPGTSVSFFDRSKYMGFAKIIGWDWDFGDPASGASNVSKLQNPAHIYATPGNYTVTLTIMELSGCQSTISKTLSVKPLPSLNMVLPSITCERTALPFSATISGEVASVLWNFGDAFSSAANASGLPDPYHEFRMPGIYTVTLTAMNVYGCTAVFSENLTISQNLLAGNITYSQPSPLCEGDSVKLTAPAGGVAWNWTTGEKTVNITVHETGIYNLTLTDGKSCTYSPGAVQVSVLSEPNGIIHAVKYDEFGQPVASFENNLQLCEGEDLTLMVKGNPAYSYAWSTGETGVEIHFTKGRGTLLPAGSYIFTVTVTDNMTTCTSVEGPFSVIVNPLPDVQITSSSSSGFICENNKTTFEVTSPDSLLTYAWSTGESGTSITAAAGGTYFVQAMNQFGCRNRSNEFIIHHAPDINLIPDGCHQRCDPDTMCLPFNETVASYQWFLNGTPINISGGNLPNPVLTQSGGYNVRITDIFGCEAISGLLSLTISPYIGFGDIGGGVYFDVNGNGSIDEADTLVSGITVFLGDGTVRLDTAASDLDGKYVFGEMPADEYSLVLDTANLPNNWIAYQDSTYKNLSGCSPELKVDWLLALDCLPSYDTVNFLACMGSSVLFDGVNIPAGNWKDFTYSRITDGCDSVVHVNVRNFPVVNYDLDAGRICWNAGNGKISVQNIRGNTLPYLFSLDGAAWRPDTLFSGLKPGEHTVFLLDRNNCIYEKTIEIPYIPPLVVQAKDETIVCGDSVLLSPVAESQLPLSWQWSNGSTLSEIWVNEPGVYAFRVSNDCETVKKAVKVNYELIDVNGLIYMPNSFSPNGDGVNDCYQGYLSPDADLQSFTLKIFNRWGGLMFESGNPNQCWDGHLEGEPLDPAVFVWFITMRVVTCEGEVIDIFKEGGIHLMK